VHEKELLAIKEALRSWRVYVENGLPVTIYTDHESLKYLKTMRNPSKRLARWLDEFGEHDLDIRYRKGSEAIIPDAISRRPDFLEAGPRNRAYIAMIKGVDEEEWTEAMIAYLRDGSQPPESIRNDIFENAVHFELGKDDELLRFLEDGRAPYVPQIFRADFLDRMHTEYGHLGYPGLLGVVGPRGWWHSLEKDIKGYAYYCEKCQMAQPSHPNQERELPHTLASPHIRIFERWAIDLIGILSLTPNKNKWILTATEYVTGWPVAVALPNAKEETVAQAIHDQIAMVYGPPQELLSDNGANLIGKVMRHYLKLFRSRYRVTSPYHPRTNGKVERFNGLLGIIFTKYLVNKPTALWDLYLPQALFACRVRIHATSRKSPYFLLFGVEPRLFEDDNPLRPGDLPIADDDIDSRITNLQHARLIANEMLVEKAIKAQKMRRELVTLTSF
jgi:transposase InsO family protein